jgi:hypothetical protein
MASSSSQFILDTIISALEAESSFNVVRIWRNDSSDPNRANVYPYVGAIQYTNEQEDLSFSGYCRAQVEILCSSIVESDPSGLGKSQEKAGLLATQVKHALESFDLENHPENVDLYYRTRILGIIVDGHIGNFNIGDNRIQIGIAVTVIFTMV